MKIAALESFHGDVRQALPIDAEDVPGEARPPVDPDLQGRRGRRGRIELQVPSLDVRRLDIDREDAVSAAGPEGQLKGAVRTGEHGLAPALERDRHGGIRESRTVRARYAAPDLAHLIAV